MNSLITTIFGVAKVYFTFCNSGSWKKNFSSPLLISIFICCYYSSLHLQCQVLPEQQLEERIQQTLKKNAGILRFMENKGQLDNRDILYYFEGRNTAMYIEKNKIRFVAKEYNLIRKKFLEDEWSLKSTHTFTLHFNGSNTDAVMRLGDAFSTKYNYFYGDNEERWVSDVHAAKDLTLQEVYPGIDIRLYSNHEGSLEFDWILKPGADYKKIDMYLQGQDNITIDKDGSLKLGLRFTDVKFHIPESYQVTDIGKKSVDFEFHADSSGHVGFTTASQIDANYPLIIDPVLTWGTFMDGNDPDFDQYLFAIQVDPVDGMVYCAGATNRQISTSSPPYDADGYLNAISGFGTGATPRVAIVYRVSNGGSDLVDLTMYGPNAVTGTDQVAAYGLSLSDNRVFISGRTTVDIPTTGSPFDATRNGNDGFVAVFSRDLGTLHYASYLGSSGAENLGATSIRAIDDDSYVVGITTDDALPASYITGGVADATFGGGTEIWIGKFNSYNSIEWGTYVGGSAEETFNDLEYFQDGRIAFAGWGNNTTAGMPQVNSAAPGSDSNANTDGLLGVLNATATAFNYLDEIGGSGNDRINDVEIINGTMAWTGSVSSGFPTSVGAFDVVHNGGLDVVVGIVSSSGGSASYKASFYGGDLDDIGSGIQKVFQMNCDGTETSFLLVFGTTTDATTDIPMVNINNEPFYDGTHNGGLDMFFAGFEGNLSNLIYSTNIGGPYNDYLGDTGDPRGANHLWVRGTNIYVGTTTHSASHTPTIVSGGFDTEKSNTANPELDDAHVLFSIEFTSLLETDHGDAPISYGVPSHILNCPQIRINTLDAEAAAIPTVNANGDDLNDLDDEDGISIFPVYSFGGPQNINITVNNVLNITGEDATLYAWIDFDNDGQFSASEFTSVAVADGFTGSKTLTWTGVTVSGTPSNQYLRLRLTTNVLIDDAGTTGVDERSIQSASNGEVEDYYLCVKPNAGTDKNLNCLVLPGGATTMNATGSGTWSAQAGNPGSATIVNATSPTTFISNFTAAGTYYFIWTNITSCGTDTVSVIVTVKPNAGNDKNVPCAVLPGGSATMSATGSGTWTAQSGNPGIATIANPTSPSTSIINFTTAGVYNFIWTNTSNCADTASITVTAKPDAGTDKNVNCVASLPGGSAAMSATGSGTWSALAGNPGSATIASPSSPTTSIPNFTMAGVYKFIWTNSSNCTDTASVTITAKPDAGTDKNVNCVATFPGGSATMSATGSGTWSAQAGNPGSATIASPSSPTTNITNFTTAGVYIFIWTDVSNCTDTASITVTAKPDAGTDKNVNCVATFPGGSAVMSATSSGTWSAQAGNPGSATIASISSPTTMISNFTVAGVYNFIWTNASNCSDTTSVIVTSKPNAGNDQMVSCVTLYPGGSTTMNATGSGTWSAHPSNPPAFIVSPLSPTTIINNFSASGNYQFIWTNSSGCKDTASIVVTSKPNAGIDQFVNCVVSFPGGTTTMAATGSGTWSAQASNPGTASINDIASPTTSIANFSNTGIYNFIWTQANGCKDTVSVTVTSKPDAGTDQLVNCIVSFPGGSATMNATGSGTWTAQAGNPGTAFINAPSSPTTNIINFTAPGVYYFIWTNASNCKDTTSILVTAKPNAGNDQNVNCVVSFPGGSATMNATGNGTWSAQDGNPGTASVQDMNSSMTNILNFSNEGIYFFIWTNADNCKDTARIIVTAKPDAGGDKMVSCVSAYPGGIATMSATGNGTWSAQTGNPGTATIANPSSSTTSILNFTAAGIYHFVWTNSSGCKDTASVTVTSKPNAGNDQTVNCVVAFPGGSATMNASGSGIWSAQVGNPGNATIVNPLSATTTIVDFTTTGIFQFIWTDGNGCKDTATVTVTVKPDAGPDQSVSCVDIFPGGSATMNASGNGIWSAHPANPGNSTIVSPSSFNTIIENFSSQGIYNFIWTNGSNCRDTATIIVTAKPDAGNDQFVSCVTVFPGGTATMNATGIGIWSAQAGNPGTASISNTSSPVTTITQYSAPGTYNFIWSQLNGCRDTASVIVTQGPVGSASPQTICSGETTNINLLSNLPGTTFTWTAVHYSGAVISGFGNCNIACGNIISQTLINASNVIPGVVRYTVIPTAPNGCIGNSFIVDVTVNPKPMGSAASKSICNSEPVNVSLNSTIPGTIFSWTAAQLSGATITGYSNCNIACGNTISDFLFNTSNTFPGVIRYSITPVSPLGCPGDPFIVDITVNPTPSGSANSQMICSGSTTSIVLNSTVPGSSFSWTADLLFGSIITGYSDCSVACGTTIGQTLSNTNNFSSGIVRYLVIPKSPQACSGSPFHADVEVKPNPLVQVNTTPACIGQSNGTAIAIASGGSPTYSYLWNTGALTQGINNLPSATYTITVTDIMGCKNSNTGTVISQGITTLTAIPGICHSLTNTYSLSGLISFQNAPASGTLTVSVGAIQQIFFAPFTSPQSYTLNGLTADGGNHTVIAVFSAEANCSKSASYTAPVDCSPRISHEKIFISAIPTASHQYAITYRIKVTNVGGAGFYTLRDAIQFDDDVIIGNVSYTSDAPGNPGGPLPGPGPRTLAFNQAIGAGSIHTYFIIVNARLDLEDASGNNTYKACGSSTGISLAGEGLFNESILELSDKTERDTACADLPYLVHVKTVSSLINIGLHTYQVEYRIAVDNKGGTATQYNLTDAPSFENDISLLNVSYSSTATGNPGNPGFINLLGNGPWTLAVNQNILAGTTHIYIVRVNVRLNLEDSAGDNQYNHCGFSLNRPSAGEGLFNESRIEQYGFVIRDTACTDVPYLVQSKIVEDIVNTGHNTYDLHYLITIENKGGASTLYNLTDAPSFDNDVRINNTSYTTSATGNPANPGPVILPGNGPWSLATNQNIAAGVIQRYRVLVNVTIDLDDVTGNNRYDKCGLAINKPLSGEGLFNEARLEINNQLIKDTACADLPYLVQNKTINVLTRTSVNTYQVEYRITVENKGGASTHYTLTDAPSFDDDMSILSSNYFSNAPGNLANPGPINLPGIGPWTLASNQNINPGSLHTYIIRVQLRLDLEDLTGDNNYTQCGRIANLPRAGEGLFNESRLEYGQQVLRDTACTDVPHLRQNKTIAAITNVGVNSFRIEYKIDVFNDGGVPAQYNLIDIPSLDNDFLIISTTYQSNAPGNTGNPGPSPLLGYGPWSLATNQNIAVGATHSYSIWVIASLDLQNQTGNNRYERCGWVNGKPAAGEGLFNESQLITDGFIIRDTACADVPYLEQNKSVVTVTQTGLNTYRVEYQITVENKGGVGTHYTLQDVPAFDSDFAITSANYFTNAVGHPANPGPVTLLGAGPWTLAINQTINPGNIQVYTIRVNANLNLQDQTGNNIYQYCGINSNQPKAGDGLFNESRLIRDGHVLLDTACADVPIISHEKTVISLNSLGGDNFRVVYGIQVKNTGASNGRYNLVDIPGFDDDFTILNANYTSTATGNSGNPGPAVLNAMGPWVLAINQNIASGAVHNYTIAVTVNLDLITVASPGDELLKPCGYSNNFPVYGEGLFNQSELDVNLDGIADQRDTACTAPESGSLGDFVWNDLNGNGIQDAGEPGMKNVIVVLYDCSTGQLIKKDTTDANGFYFFEKLMAPKDYLVRFDLSLLGSGYAMTLTNRGSDDTKDSDANSSGIGPCTRINIGEYDDSYDAGVIGYASISDYVWNDKNADGIQSPGEEGIAKIKVSLFDAATKILVKSVETDVNGLYSFNNLVSKDYYLKFDLPAGFNFTQANQGFDYNDSDVDHSNGLNTTATTHLSPGENDRTWDAGLTKCVILSGDVWYDVNRDGIYDPEEKGINGLKVYIINALTGDTVDILITNIKPWTPSEDGYYKSECLNPGVYYLWFERPGHLGASAPFMGTNRNKDSDITHENGVNTTNLITVFAGDIINNIGAGFQTKSMVGDKVWIDHNFNGLQDPGEEPMAGVKVMAYNTKGVKISESVSGSNGQFILDGLVQGDMYVKFELTNPKYGFTQAHTGTDELDSDVDGTYGYGTTKMYTILAGESRPTIDAGIVSQTLALDWLDFYGVFNGSFTELSWITGNDEDNSHFIVQRRYEMESQFSDIGRVNAWDDPALIEKDYDFDDFSVGQPGIYYYRIQQIDKDGRYTFSKTIAIEVTFNNDQLNIHVYPNPVRDLLKIELWIPEDSNVDIMILDMNGKSLGKAPISGFKTRGRYNEILKTEELINGHYMIQVKTVNGIIYSKFLVSR